jgi:PPOX class probable F420-dependent enzyme
MPPILTPGARALLEQSRIAHLATAGRDARPHVVPLCYLLDGDSLYFVVDEKPKTPGKALKRMRNIAENPAVALIVDRYDEDWTRLEYLLVQGRAEVVRDLAEFERVVDRLRSRYPQYRAMRLEHGRNPLVRIEPLTAHHWKAS